MRNSNTGDEIVNKERKAIGNAIPWRSKSQCEERKGRSVHPIAHLPVRGRAKETKSTQVPGLQEMRSTQIKLLQQMTGWELERSSIPSCTTWQLKSPPPLQRKEESAVERVRGKCIGFLETHHTWSPTHHPLIRNGKKFSKKPWLASCR